MKAVICDLCQKPIRKKDGIRLAFMRLTSSRLYRIFSGGDEYEEVDMCHECFWEIESAIRKKKEKPNA